MLRKEIAVKIMNHLVTHDGDDGHGYSQYSRNGDGKGYCTIKIDGNDYKVRTGDRDCSSAVINAYEAAGISCGGATYTGNMRSCMVKTGNFRWHPMSSGYIAKAGDIYLNEVNHTAMCLSDNPDKLMEFCISEKGTIDGKEGDQNGQESRIANYYNYPWDGILECINASSVPASTEKSDQIKFTVSTKKSAKGFIKKLAIKVNKGTLKYRVHEKGKKWLPWVTGYSWKDHENGYAGDTKEIDAVQVVWTYGKKKAKYRVAPKSGVYYEYQINTEKTNGQDGYAGVYGKPITKFQIKVG